MKQPKPKDERRYGVWWRCETCEGKPEYEHRDFAKHLLEIHGIDGKKVPGNRRMTMHMDGSDWFSSTYEWTIKGLEFTQFTCSKRDKDDLMSMFHEG